MKNGYLIRIGWMYGMLMLAAFVGCNSAKPEPKEEVPKISEVTRSVLGYLSLPEFVNEGFEKKVIGNYAHFLRFDPQSSLVYFSLIPPQERSELHHLCTDTSQIEFGKIEGNYMYLSPYKSRNLNRLLLKFPAHLLKIRQDSLLTATYRTADYHISLEELSGFYSRNSIYDSPALFEFRENGKRYGIANHSAVVAPYGESSLTQLVHQLVPEGSSKERAYQKLLDFVSEEIDYEYINKYEIFFKPNEVLLRRKSDCSGKVVLYASLLEQMKLDYLLVYTEGHILVAVPGKFSRRNNMNFQQGDRTYFFAETTLAGFKIGKTQTFPLMTEDDIQFLQKGGTRTRLYDYVKKDSLEFMTMEVEVRE